MGVTWRYVYDAENRLKEVWRGAERVAAYRYDAEGERVVREVGGVRTVVVDEGDEVRGGGVRKVYRLGGERVAVREADAVDAAVGDHLGSVTVLAQGGSVVGATRYLPYGAIRWETGLFLTDRRFTGQRWEGVLGLYDYRARFYDPVLGRFIQPDPIVPEPGNPQALNRYAYVYNNPLHYTDPSGHCPWCGVIGFGALIGAGVSYGWAQKSSAQPSEGITRSRLRGSERGNGPFPIETATGPPPLPDPLNPHRSPARVSTQSPLCGPLPPDPHSHIRPMADASGEARRPAAN